MSSDVLTQYRMRARSFSFFILYTSVSCSSHSALHTLKLHFMLYNPPPRLTAAPTAPTAAPVPQHVPVNPAPSLRALSTTLPESSQGPFQVRRHWAAIKTYCRSKRRPCTRRAPAQSLSYENQHASRKIPRK